MSEPQRPALPFRVIDTGVRDGRANIAFDEAMIELHREGRIPDTVRFLRFEPTALVGRHQAISQELKLDYCRDNGIGLARRITGGGAIYFDTGVLGWELVLSRRRLALPGLADYARQICESVADGLARAFAVPARYRPRNDIEVEGRKLSGTGGFFDGDTLFYQGTVLIDVVPARVMSCLNVPRAKLEKRALDSAEQRIVTLKELLGTVPPANAIEMAVMDGLERGLGLALERADVSPDEERLAAEIHRTSIGTDAFLFEIDRPEGSDVLAGDATSAGGTIAAYIRVEGPHGARRIREALVTGDFFITPPRLVLDLEAHLRGVAIGEAGDAVEAFFATHRPQMLSVTPADFRRAIEAALAARA